MVFLVISAVSVAMLLDLATTLSPLLLQSQNSGTSSLGLDLVFFDGEEAFREWSSTDSLYGSRHLADLWRKQSLIQNIELFVLLDLIGARAPRFLNWFPATSAQFKAIGSIASQLGLLKLLHGPSASFFASNSMGYSSIEDDHKPFEALGE